MHLALSNIPGLDLEFGLKAVRGRMGSYKRLLGKFAETHSGDFELIRKCLAENNPDEARRLAHSLKGAAGSLGAVAVQKVAAALEIAIRDQYAANETASLIAQTDEIYSNLKNELASKLTADAPPPQANRVSAEQLAPLVSQLYEMLESCEMNVQPLVRAQQPALAALLGHQLLAFDNLVASFDFDTALKLLDESCSQFPGLAAHFPRRSFGKKD